METYNLLIKMEQRRFNIRRLFVGGVIGVEGLGVFEAGRVGVIGVIGANALFSLGKGRSGGDNGEKPNKKSEKVDSNKVTESASKDHKGGESVAGHALQKHAGRNPNIWGKISGGAKQINEQAMKHINEIINGVGEFKKISASNGVQFLEKMLPDGRGIRLNLDGTFKGFIDQIR